jgi:RimJ/RimL family protein N-acetyltransferase
VKLETGRPELRSAVPGDASNLLSLFSNSEVLRFLPPFPPMTIERAEQAIERRMKMETEHGFAPSVVTVKKGGTFIGSGGIVPLEDTEELEIVYHLLPVAWGKGYATEAAAAILAFAFGTIGLERVIGLAFPENIGSWKVLEKIGMRYVGSASFYGINGLKKYIAERVDWAPAQRSLF